MANFNNKKPEIQNEIKTQKIMKKYNEKKQKQQEKLQHEKNQLLEEKKKLMEDLQGNPIKNFVRPEIKEMPQPVTEQPVKEVINLNLKPEEPDSAPDAVSKAEDTVMGGDADQT